MDRRAYLKALALGTLTAGTLASSACKDKAKEKGNAASLENPLAGPARTPEEIAHYNKVVSETFFTEHEMKTMAVLCDIIIPSDEHSEGALAAHVPDFIEFIVKDMPQHKTPMRGGLRWLDIQCQRDYEAVFVHCTKEQQMELVDKIAWGEKTKPELKQGAAFFNLMRNLTASGYYTSKIGIKDLNYKGNTPNRWDGVPEDVLKAHGLAYTQKELDECVKFDW